MNLWDKNDGYAFNIRFMVFFVAVRQMVEKMGFSVSKDDDPTS